MCSSYDQMSAGNFVLYDTVCVGIVLKKGIFSFENIKKSIFSPSSITPSIFMLQPIKSQGFLLKINLNFEPNLDAFFGHD